MDAVAKFTGLIKRQESVMECPVRGPIRRAECRKILVIERRVLNEIMIRFLFKLPFQIGIPVSLFLSFYVETFSTVH